MTDKTHASTETPLEEMPKGKVKFYRNKRIVRSILLSLIVLGATGNFFLFVLSHVMLTLFWDWWFFTHKGFKDSTQAPEAYFQWAKVTPEQMNAFNAFMIKLRRIAFPLSVMMAGACLLFYPDFGYDIAFWLTYTLGVFCSAVIAETLGKIKYPYPFEGTQEKLYNLPYPMSVINSPFFDPSSDNLAINPLGPPHKFKSPTYDPFSKNLSQTKGPFD